MRRKLKAQNLSILIVDDVKSMRSIVRSLLKNVNIGQSFHMAENGIEGLKILHTTPVDLAIVDWKMPVMNGTRMLEEIRKDRMLRDLPVIMVTGVPEKEIVLEAAEIEVEGYLLKPLTPAVLEAKIRMIIDQVNHPDKATQHVRTARRLEEDDDIESAIAHMTRAAQLKPGASRLQRNLGLLFEKSGDEARMVDHLKKAVSINPQDVVSHRMLGDFYWRKGELVPAVCYYHDVVSMTRKFSHEAVELGEALLKEKQSRNAKLLFSGIMAKSPRDQELIEKIVEICLCHDEYEYALNLVKRLIRDFPSGMGLIYQAGSICEAMDDTDGALEYFQMVDKHQMYNLDVKLKLARLYITKKKIIQADDYINQILKKDPKNEDAITLRRLV